MSPARSPTGTEDLNSSKPVSMTLTKTVRSGESLISFRPKLKAYFSTTRGVERCQCCGIEIPSAFTTRCSGCLSIFYCSTMCLVQHKVDIHKHECDTLCELAKFGVASNLPLLMVARVLIHSRKHPDFESWLKNASGRLSECTFFKNIPIILSCLFKRDEIEAASAVVQFCSLSLFDERSRPVGVFLEPSLAFLEHSLSPTAFLKPKSRASFEIISVCDLKPGSDVTINHPRPFVDMQDSPIAGTSHRTVASSEDCEKSLYFSLTCPWCKSPIHGVLKKELRRQLLTALPSPRKCRLKNFCRACSRNIPPRSFKDAIILYRKLALLFVKHHRIDLAEIRGDQELLDRLSRCTGETQMKRKTYRDVIALLTKASTSKLLPAYCFPLNSLWSMVSNTTMATEKHLIMGTAKSILLRRLFVLLHVDFASAVPHSAHTTISVISKAEHLMSSLVNIAEEEGDENFRCIALQSKRFFQIQGRAWRTSISLQAADSCEDASMSNEEIMWRSVRWVFKRANVILDSSDEGQSLRLANGQNAVVFLSQRRCVQLLDG